MKIEKEKKLSFDDVLIKPTHSKISSRSQINLKVSYKTLYSGNIIEGVPIIVSNMDTVGTIKMAKTLYKEDLFVCLHKFIPEKDLLNFFSTEESGNSFYTLGIQEEEVSRMIAFNKKIPLSKICLDVANGYMQVFLDKIKYIRDSMPNVIIMAGNICTPEGAELIIKAGADIVKAGIANGGHCDTKFKAGVGYKQFSVALECGQAANELGALCCSDGGCKISADFCKALGAGSHFCMAGTIFGGHDQCDAEWVHDEHGNKHMLMYGMSSKIANEKYLGGIKSYATSEGKETFVPYKGDILPLINDIKGSLTSCCAYTNNSSLQELSKNCVFTI